MLVDQIKTIFLLQIKLIRVFFQMVFGAWKVSRLTKPIISIFGGSRLAPDDTYFIQAHELAYRLAKTDISVLTGGGPGIMEAASCGAASIEKGKGRVMGISVTDLDEKEDPCAQEYLELDYFFARKWLLTRYSVAFVAFPGGFGTLDEIAEILTLMQTKQMEKMPMILVGIEFWAPFMSWLKTECLKHGTISEQDLSLFVVTDDLEQVFCIVRDECEKRKNTL